MAATASELEELLKVVGDDVIRAYRDKYFPVRIIQACPTVYSVDNASKWVNFEKFCAFVAQFLQERSPPPTPEPFSTRPRSGSAPSTISGPFINRPRKCSTSTCQTSAADRPTSDTEESDNDMDAVGCVARKRKRGVSTAIKQSERKLAAGMVQVTRQSWVSRVETLTEVPDHWRVPEMGNSVAYIMDLSGHPNDHQDNQRRMMAMSAIIKQKCTDAWTGGTGGSVTKATTVTLLGEGVKCQKMSHECRGAFICGRAPADLWKNYKRTDSDLDAMYLLRNGIGEPPEEASNTGHFERSVECVCMIARGRPISVY
ncbi:hypothetical protein JB92DRAFT_636867 [Gautieria morchelliformis]|nr:hypothetical protein JB92DRAFT_636867 [Gautieria morchelliformis]